jgi:bla regulator protein BlaR1
MLDFIFLNFISASLIASILIILVLAVKKMVGDRLSIRFYNMLWLLVLLRLVMPFTIESPFNMIDLFPASSHMFSNYDTLFQEQSNCSITEEERQGNFINESSKNRKTNISQPFPTLIRILVFIWLLGAFLSALLYLIITISFVRQKKNFNKLTDPEIQQLLKRCCEKIHIHKNIPLYTNSYFKTPCISGLINPSIYLPEDICKKNSPYQLQYILLHELAHYKRKDLFYNLWAALVLSIHWFNPLVWLAVKEMRYDREVAADIYVMELIGEDGIMPYGMSIINLASLFSKKRLQFNLLNFNETNNQVERRITMIKKFKKGSYKISVIAVIAFIAIAVLVFTQTNRENTSAVGPNTALQEKLVVIDPGHGGIDLGASYPQNISDINDIEVMEKDLNLKISLKLYDMLKESGINVKMTRQEDKEMSPEERVVFANDEDASLFVSIHNESQPDSSQNGTVTFFCPSSTKSSFGITDEKAAQIIHGKLTKQLNTTDRGLCQASFKVLKSTDMPAVLTDIAYISNEADREHLMTEEFRTKAAQALHDGIIEILEEMIKTES